MNSEVYVACQSYLKHLCAAEYNKQRTMYKGRANKFRYTPSDYVRELITCLDKDDEAAFKALKMLQGYSSALGF